jgi:septal ring factor EnvC (AmiA/AmiB activator)
LPNLRSLSQLRVLLPYAAKLLPVLTGVAIAESPRQGADLSSVDRRFGEIQIESRGLRSQLADQGEEIERILKTHQEALERIASAMESIRREQQELANAFRSLAGLLRGLFFAILFLLVAITVLSVLILFRMSHV